MDRHRHLRHAWTARRILAGSGQRQRCHARGSLGRRRSRGRVQRGPARREDARARGGPETAGCAAAHRATQGRSGSACADGRSPAEFAVTGAPVLSTAGLGAEVTEPVPSATITWYWFRLSVIGVVLVGVARIGRSPRGCR